MEAFPEAGHDALEFLAEGFFGGGIGGAGFACGHSDLGILQPGEAIGGIDLLGEHQSHHLGQLGGGLGELLACKVLGRALHVAVAPQSKRNQRDRNKRERADDEFFLER